MSSTKAHIGSRCLHSYVMLSSVLTKKSFSIKPPSVEKMQLCIMGDINAVQFHHLPISVLYSTYKVQSDLFQYNCRNWPNIFAIRRNAVIIM